jgi:hypothetical protein
MPLDMATGASLIIKSHPLYVSANKTMASLIYAGVQKKRRMKNRCPQ